MKIELTKKQKFNNRKEIIALLGGDEQKGIAPSKKIKAILLFKNEDEIYKDYFYQKDNQNFYMHTGIGRWGHQDSVTNNMYMRNIAVLNHKSDKKALLVFEKQETSYLFAGEYKLIETHQNVQPDADGIVRRVFVFHLEQVSDVYSCKFN